MALFSHYQSNFNGLLDRRFWQAIVFQFFIRDKTRGNGTDTAFINIATVADWLASNGITPVSCVETVSEATKLGVTREDPAASRGTIYHKGLEDYFWALCESRFLRADYSNGERYEVIFDRYEMPPRMKEKLRWQADEQARQILRTQSNDSHTQMLEAYLAKGRSSARWTCGACGQEYLFLKGAPQNVAKCTHCGAYEGAPVSE